MLNKVYTFLLFFLLVFFGLSNHTQANGVPLPGDPLGLIIVPSVTFQTNPPSGGVQPGQAQQTSTSFNENLVDSGGSTLWTGSGGSATGNQTGSAYGVGLVVPSGPPVINRVTTTATVSGPVIPGTTKIAGPVDSNGDYSYLESATVSCGAAFNQTVPIAGSSNTFVINPGTFGNSNCSVTYNYASFTDPGAGSPNPDPSTTPGNGATFQGYSGIPATVTPGQSLQIQVSFRNTGTSVWTPSSNTDTAICPSHNGYSLHNIATYDWQATDNSGTPPQRKNIIDLEEWDGSQWNPKAVGVGGFHTFFVNVTAPTIPGSYPFQWRIHENCKEDFDQSSTLTYINVAGTVSLPNLKVHTPSASFDPVGRTSGTVVRGQTYDLTWAPTNPSGATCTASGTWSGSKSTSGGTENKGSDAQTVGLKSYTLTCIKGGVANSETVTVDVTGLSLPCDPYAMGTNKLSGCVYQWTPDPLTPWPGFVPNWNDPGWLLHSQAPDGPTISGAPNSGDLANIDWGTGGPNGLSEKFMVLYRGQFDQFNGGYTFTSGSDDGHYLVVAPGNSTYTLISPAGEWSEHTYRTVTSSPTLFPAGNSGVFFSLFDAPNTVNTTAKATLSFNKVITPVADIRANGSYDPVPSIPYNTSATISWSSLNATSCSISPTGWTGLSGSQSTGNLTSGRTYTASCVNGAQNDSKSVTVVVDPPTSYNLTTIKAGQGTVTSTPAGINCGSTCGYDFVPLTVVNLTATPNTGRVFAGWGGACTGSVPTCNVTIDSDKTVYAYFAVDPSFKEF